MVLYPTCFESSTVKHVRPRRMHVLRLRQGDPMLFNKLGIVQTSDDSYTRNMS
jgi:hypothetical protein